MNTEWTEQCLQILWVWGWACGRHLRSCQDGRMRCLKRREKGDGWEELFSGILGVISCADHNLLVDYFSSTQSLACGTWALCPPQPLLPPHTIVPCMEEAGPSYSLFIFALLHPRIRRHLGCKAALHRICSQSYLMSCKRLYKWWCRVTEGYSRRTVK